MGLIIDGKDYSVGNLKIENVSLSKEDYKPRPKTWVRGIVLHTTKGIPGGHDTRKQDIIVGLGPNTDRDKRIVKMWSLDSRHAGAHLIADHDASWVCTCDLVKDATFHAGNVNDVTIGIEIYQGDEAELYLSQLESVVTMIDFLTKIFGIQRQFHWPYLRFATTRGLRRGLDMVGIYGHRDCSNNRGSGDPGDKIFELLRDAGYESYNYQLNEDKNEWKLRQKDLGLLQDGVPGPRTVTELLNRGYKHGLLISRPGD